MSFDADVRARLGGLGLELPTDLPAPAGAYEPWRLHDGLGFLAAQVPAGPHAFGRAGAELSVGAGTLAAENAALNALGRIHEALGRFDRLIGLLHVAGHVAAAPTFLDAPAILDGASLLFTGALADRGRHGRTAFLVPRLPKDVRVELEIMFAYGD